GISFNSTAQNPTGKEANIWYFGYKAGLDFNHNPPIALTNGLTEGTGGFASIADGNGNLLFYVTPDSILDRNHQKMPNSSSLHGGDNLNAGINSAVVVPWPANPGKYFCFYPYFGLGYSVIDMSLRNGLGDVVP